MLLFLRRLGHLGVDGQVVLGAQRDAGLLLAADANVDRHEVDVALGDRVASTSEIWDQAQLPFCTKAHLPRAKSTMESVTVLAAAAKGATVELLR